MLPGDTQYGANMPIDEEGQRPGAGSGNGKRNVYSSDAVDDQTLS